jgi:hypothetical protein
MDRPRDEFLARAILPLDQDRGIGLGNAAICGE